MAEWVLIELSVIEVDVLGRGRGHDSGPVPFHLDSSWVGGRPGGANPCCFPFGAAPIACIDVAPAVLRAVERSDHFDLGTRGEPPANEPALARVLSSLDATDGHQASKSGSPTGLGEATGAAAPPGAAAAAEGKGDWAACLGHFVAEARPLAGSLVGDVTRAWRGFELLGGVVPT